MYIMSCSAGIGRHKVAGHKSGQLRGLLVTSLGGWSKYSSQPSMPPPKQSDKADSDTVVLSFKVDEAGSSTDIQDVLPKLRPVPRPVVKLPAPQQNATNDTSSCASISNVSDGNSKPTPPPSPPCPPPRMPSPH